jgi:hypothetical protein
MTDIDDCFIRDVVCNGLDARRRAEGLFSKAYSPAARRVAGELSSATNGRALRVDGGVVQANF